MNTLAGQILAIESNGHVSLVDVAVAGHRLTATLIATSGRQTFVVGENVNVIFKETELSLAKNLAGLLSLRNRLPLTVMDISSGKILTEIALDFSGQMINSIITTRSMQILQLTIGDQIEGLIKANEVVLETAP